MLLTSERNIKLRKHAGKLDYKYLCINTLYLFTKSRMFYVNLVCITFLVPMFSAYKHKDKRNLHFQQMKRRNIVDRSYC